MEKVFVGYVPGHSLVLERTEKEAREGVENLLLGRHGEIGYLLEVKARTTMTRPITWMEV